MGLSETATFPADAVVRVTATYLDREGYRVVTGETLSDVRRWPIRFALRLPVIREGHVNSPIGVSARVEFEGRVILVTEETYCEWNNDGTVDRRVELVLRAAVE